MGYKGPARMIAGQVTVSASAVDPGNFASVVVPYGRSFSAPPFVFVSLAGAPGGTAYLVPRASGVGTTGFTLYVYNVGAVAWSWSNLAVNWQAVP